MSIRREELVRWPTATAGGTGWNTISVSTSATAEADLTGGVPGTYLFQAIGADVAFTLGETGLAAPTYGTDGYIPQGQILKIEVSGDQPKIRTDASGTGKLAYKRIL